MENARCSTFLASARVYRPSDRLSRYITILLCLCPPLPLLSALIAHASARWPRIDHPFFANLLACLLLVIDYRCLREVCVCVCVYARDVVFLRYINTQSDGCINTVGGERCRLFSIYNFAEPVLQSASLRMEWDRGYLIPRCFYRESHSLDGLDVHKLRRPRDPRAKYPAGIRLVVSRGGGEHRFLEHWNVRPSPPPTPRLSRLEQRVTTTRRGSVIGIDREGDDRK